MQLRELESELEDFKAAFAAAKTGKLKAVLQPHVDRMSKEVTALQQQAKAEAQRKEVEAEEHSDAQPAAANPKAAAAAMNRCSFPSMSGYSWDETDTTIKIYGKCPDAGEISLNQVSVCVPDPNTLLVVVDNGVKQYQLRLTPTKEPLSQAENSAVVVKTKPNEVVVKATKKSRGKWWSLLEDTKFKTSTKKGKEDDDAADPSKSIMNLMKQMYDDGDDNMKQTIAKAWTESRQKQGGMGMDKDML